MAILSPWPVSFRFFTYLKYQRCCARLIVDKIASQKNKIFHHLIISRNFRHGYLQFWNNYINYMLIYMVCRESCYLHSRNKKNESLSYDLPHSLFVANFIGSVDILSSLYVCVVKKNVCLVFVETPGTYKFCLRLHFASLNFGVYTIIIGVCEI